MMYKTKHILTKSCYYILAALFVILSSCTVRKSIQAQLDISTAQQQNPSKVTFSQQENCEKETHYLAGTTSLEKEVKKQDFNPYFPIDFAKGTSYHLVAINSTQQSVVSLQILPKNPLYILYKNLKVHI